MVTLRFFPDRELLVAEAVVGFNLFNPEDRVPLVLVVPVVLTGDGGLARIGTDGRLPLLAVVLPISMSSLLWLFFTPRCLSLIHI